MYKCSHDGAGFRGSAVHRPMVEGVLADLGEAELRAAEDVDQNLDRRAHIATNGELLEGDHHVLARFITSVAPREEMSEL